MWINSLANSYDYLRQRPNGPHFPFIDTKEFPTADGVVRCADKGWNLLRELCSQNTRAKSFDGADKSVSTQAMDLDDRKTTT
ncbi:hypothetical protein N2597_03400 [Rhizobium sophoriradicis]|uniref:hypothetical protein n=1 Tax=Rhizobium sophoriradicis TaxID=1535245 RepID=UPI00160F66E7|nr:hypothetical protein N2597_03400 [Rhizobium leguminosarum bv. phaseoli]